VSWTEAYRRPPPGPFFIGEIYSRLSFLNAATQKPGQHHRDRVPLPSHARSGLLWFLQFLQSTSRFLRFSLREFSLPICSEELKTKNLATLPVQFCAQ
jgi:hypothetical protein